MNHLKSEPTINFQAICMDMLVFEEGMWSNFLETAYNHQSANHPQANYETSFVQRFVHKHPNIKNNVKRRTDGVESHLTQWFNYIVVDKKKNQQNTPVTEIIRPKNRQYGISHGSKKCWVGHITTSHRHLSLVVDSEAAVFFVPNKNKSNNGGLLVGGWTNPSWKIFVKLGSSSPIFGVNIKNIWNHQLVWYSYHIFGDVVKLKAVGNFQVPFHLAWFFCWKVGGGEVK